MTEEVGTCYECTWIDTEFNVEIGTYDKTVPSPGDTTSDGFKVERVERDDDNQCITIYGTWYGIQE